MAHGHYAFGMVMMVVSVLAGGGFLYLMYSISKSLKRISENIGNK